MKILAISGALRKASTNTGLLRALKELAPPTVEIEIVTLHGIPLYDGDVEQSEGKPQSVIFNITADPEAPCQRFD